MKWPAGLSANILKCCLREEHIAVFQANWNDKATNIKAIADTLALGLDSLVFLDDNPAERAIVREFLPQVQSRSCRPTRLSMRGRSAPPDISSPSRSPVRT